MASNSGRPEIDRSQWWSRLWDPFWVLPALIATGSVIAGAVLPHADEAFTGWFPYVFESGPDGARQFLGTIASAMISVTGLVFSITMVVLQLASSQFTPRLLGQFLQSRTVQLTLGVFTGSFLYALTVLRRIRGASGATAEFVPQVSITVAFGYVITAVAFFVAFLHHITRSVRLSEVLGDIGERTRDGAQRLYAGERAPGSWSPPPGDHGEPVHWEEKQGHVSAIDSSGLVEWAAQRDAVVRLHLGLGDFVVPGDRIGTWWPGRQSKEEKGLATFVRVERERVLDDDFAYGVRQLTDIAERALSPGINDPTTAVQVLDELYAVLRPLATRPDLSPYLVDEAGRVRGIYRPPTFASLIDTSIGEIAHYAEDAPRVLQRAREVIDALTAAAIPDHTEALAKLSARLSPGASALPPSAVV